MTATGAVVYLALIVGGIVATIGGQQVLERRLPEHRAPVIIGWTLTGLGFVTIAVSLGVMLAIGLTLG